jgi:hypothetical protein
VRAAPNREMVADRRGSPWWWGGGNGGGRKCDEDRGGSVASVDERQLVWLWVEESEWGTRRGGAPGFRRRVEGKTGEGSVGSKIWIGMARTRRLRAAPTVVGSACLTGMVGACGEQGMAAGRE